MSVMADLTWSSAADFPHCGAAFIFCHGKITQTVVVTKHPSGSFRLMVNLPVTVHQTVFSMVLEIA